MDALHFLPRDTGVLRAYSQLLDPLVVYSFSNRSSLVTRATGYDAGVKRKAVWWSRPSALENQKDEVSHWDVIQYAC
jgi:hypothetical protein